MHTVLAIVLMHKLLVQPSLAVLIAMAEAYQALHAAHSVHANHMYGCIP